MSWYTNLIGWRNGQRNVLLSGEATDRVGLGAATAAGAAGAHPERLSRPLCAGCEQPIPEAYLRSACPYCGSTRKLEA